MDKSILTQINSTRVEIKELKKKLDKINQKPVNVVRDSVRGSSRDYPYIEHNCIIEGIDEQRVVSNKRNRNKYKKLIKSRELKLEKLLVKLEYELNHIEDSEIRRIMQYRYEDELNWVQIMFKMEYNSESTARMKHDRFLENL